MKPTKFYYQEDPFRAKCVLIEWTDRGLELQKSKAWEPHFFTESDICLHPSDEDWNRFVEEVKALDLHPSSTFESWDRIAVNCHIKFRNNLVKFSIKDQDFFGFDRFKLLVNDLTKCQEFPRGIFDREEEEKEMENFR